jgi:hypothetical protein
MTVVLAIIICGFYSTSKVKINEITDAGLLYCRTSIVLLLF